MGDLGGVAQAGASMADTAATDAANIYMQKQAQQFNASQAALGRQFSAQQQANAQQFSAGEQLQAENYNTQMSNTQVQRRADDIKAAGFNPLLAAGQLGGASSPTMSAPGSPALGGPTASSPSPPQLQGLLQNAAQLRLATAQAANVNQNTKVQASQKDQIDYQNAILAMDSSAPVLVARQQAMIAKYGLDYATASEVDAAVQSIRNGVKSQNLDLAAKEFSNQMASMDVTAQRATLNTLIEMRNAVNAQQTQEAKNVLWVQSIPFLSKTIATAQAVLTPVATGAQAAHSGASALEKLVP